MYSTNKKDNNPDDSNDISNDMSNEMSNDTTHSNASLLYQEHKRRLEGIATSKILLDLMLEIQRHRAASLASLGGDVFFENRLWSIQKAVTRHLASLDNISVELLTEQEKRTLYGEWVTIRSQWQKDTTMQNFLLHSHLIDFILKLNTSIAVKAGHTRLMNEHQALTDYCMRQLPLLIETAAQARGLATHCAAQQQNAPLLISRIRFLINEIEQLDEQAQHSVIDCSTRCYSIIQQARRTNKCQEYMTTFLTRLKDHFTDSTQPTLLSDEIYTTGSHFIMATYDVLLRAYKLMSKGLDQEMQNWIHRSSYQS